MCFRALSHSPRLPLSKKLDRGTDLEFTEFTGAESSGRKRPKMITERKMSAIEAMDLSETEDRIVHLDYSEAVRADLFADSDGESESDGVFEFWGEGWRVHLHTVGA